MKRWIALSALAALLAACGNQCNHHECDVDAYAAHCDEDGNLVTCQDETTGEPCALSEGCDTYVTTTTCATSCVALTSSSAACAEDADNDAGGHVNRDAGHADASDDSGDNDASDDDASDADVADGAADAATED